MTDLDYALHSRAYHDFYYVVGKSAGVSIYNYKDQVLQCRICESIWSIEWRIEGRRVFLPIGWWECPEGCAEELRRQYPRRAAEADALRLWAPPKALVRQALAAGSVNTPALADVPTEAPAVERHAPTRGVQLMLKRIEEAYWGLCLRSPQSTRQADVGRLIDRSESRVRSVWNRHAPRRWPPGPPPEGWTPPDWLQSLLDRFIADAPSAQRLPQRTVQ